SEKIGHWLHEDQHQTVVGLQQGQDVGPIVGYGLTDDLLLNARLLVGYCDGSLLGNASGGRMARLPRPPDLFARGSFPYALLGATLGLMIDDVTLASTETQIAQVILAGQLGAHAFVGDHLSLDPSLMIGFHGGGGRQRPGALGDGDDSISVS